MQFKITLQIAFSLFCILALAQRCHGMQADCAEIFKEAEYLEKIEGELNKLTISMVVHE